MGTPGEEDWLADTTELSVARAGEFVPPPPPPPPPLPPGEKLDEDEPVIQERCDACKEGNWVTELEGDKVGATTVSVGELLGETEGVEEAFTLPLLHPPVPLATDEKDTVGVDCATDGVAPETLAKLDPEGCPPVQLGGVLALKASEPLLKNVELCPNEALGVKVE